MTAETGALLEKDQRFSDSVLWGFNRRYYASKGPMAWHSGEVPSYATCNTFIARAYAKTTMSYLRDARAAGLLDPAHPVYIVELAAGVGRFAYQFLQKLEQLRAPSSLADLDIRYVMTDFNTTNPTVWSTHPSLQPFVQSGRLAFGLFDVDSDREIRLLAGGTLSKETVKNPIVVLANYAFDTFRHDLFRFADGQVHEVTVSVRSPDPEPDLEKTELISKLRLQYGARPIDPRTYYRDPALGRVLAHYGERLAEVTMALPYSGFIGLHHLMEMAGDRLLLLSSDKGFTDDAELFHPHQDSMQFHTGCFSMMVNYAAIGRYFVELGGRYRASHRRSLTLRTVACMVGGTDAQFADTLSTIREEIEDFGPGEFFELLQAHRARKDAPTFEAIMGFLRMSGFDPTYVWDNAVHLRAIAQSLNETQQVELVQAIERAWRNYYPGPQNFPFEVARVFMAMRRPVDGIRFSKIGIEWFGESPAALLNMGICYYYAENLDEAARCFERALAINTHFGLARAWLARVGSERIALDAGPVGLASVVAARASAAPLAVLSDASAPIVAPADPLIPIVVNPPAVKVPAIAPAPADASAAPDPERA